MGCLQLRRWMSFFPAAFFVYILLHYFIYQPVIQDSQTSYFVGKDRTLKSSTVKPEPSSPLALSHPGANNAKSSVESLPVAMREPLGTVEFNAGLEGSIPDNYNERVRENLNSAVPDFYDGSYANEDKNRGSDTGLVSSSDGRDIGSRESDNEIRQGEGKDESGSGIKITVIKNDVVPGSDQLFGHSRTMADLDELHRWGAQNTYQDTGNNLRSQNFIDQSSPDGVVPAVPDQMYYDEISQRIQDLQKNGIDHSGVKTGAEAEAVVSPHFQDLRENGIVHPEAVKIGADAEAMVSHQSGLPGNQLSGNSNWDHNQNSDQNSEDPQLSGRAELHSSARGLDQQNLNPAGEQGGNQGDQQHPVASLNIHSSEDKGQPIPAGSSMPPAAGVKEASSPTVDTRGQEDSAPEEKVNKNPTPTEGLSKSGEGEKSAPDPAPDPVPTPVKQNLDPASSGNQPPVEPAGSNSSIKRGNTPEVQLPQETHAPPQGLKNNSNHGSEGGKKNQPPPPQKNEGAPTPGKSANSKQATKNAPATNSINSLKGKTTVGDRYESGFTTPQEDLCPNNGRDLRVLILITTAPDHEKHRNAIRQTWGSFSLRKDVSLGFVVGRSSKPDVQAVIDKENERYGDIIEANFVDHYVNLTLKTVAMLEWTKVYCSEARLFLKTDDDMFINVPLLLAFIRAKSTERRAIFGRLASGWKPVRNRKSKYYIDTAIYSRARYPDFLTGPAYLMTNDVVEDLYRRTLQAPFFVLEDVLITGMVGESLGIKRVGDSHFRNEKVKLTDTCKLMQSISIHMVKYDEQFDIYKRTLDGKTKCRIRK